MKLTFADLCLISKYYIHIYYIYLYIDVCDKLFKHLYQSHRIGSPNTCELSEDHTIFTKLNEEYIQHVTDEYILYQRHF